MKQEQIQYIDARKKESPEEIYLKHLNLSWDDLRNKKILEVGASYANIAAEGKKKGVDIISLDHYPYENLKDKKHYILGEVENLPIKKESMNIVFSMNGPMNPWYGTPEEVRARFIECWKILENKGKLYIWPAWIEGKETNDRKYINSYVDQRIKNLSTIVGDIFDIKVIETEINDRPFFGGNFTFILEKK